MVVSPVDKYRIEYTKLLDREKKAESFMNDPKVSNELKQQWTPEYKKLTDRLAYLLETIGHYYASNILNGWPELLNRKEV